MHCEEQCNRLYSRNNQRSGIKMSKPKIAKGTADLMRALVCMPPKRHEDMKATGPKGPLRRKPSKTSRAK